MNQFKIHALNTATHNMSGVSTDRVRQGFFHPRGRAFKPNFFYKSLVGV